MGYAKLLITTLFVIGLLLILVDLVRSYYECPQNKVIYKFIPRSFREEQENPVPLNDIFYTMFNNPSPWVATVDVDRRKKDIGENINKYYLTQI
jgi:hypothetical protein